MKIVMMTLIPLLAVALTACGNSGALPDDPSLSSAPIDNSPDAGATKPAEPSNPSESNPSSVDAVLQKYQYVDPQSVVNTKVLQDAILAFDANKSKFANQNYIVVVDFTLRSNNHRFFVVNMKTGAVTGYPVGHGRNSDGNPNGTSTGYAVRFSNTSGSNESSLGMYRTAETYSGKHGYSMRIDGLSSTNSNARARTIVVHGADYVQDTNVVQGRSDGCFALPMNERVAVIDQIKSGAMIWAGLEK